MNQSSILGFVSGSSKQPDTSASKRKSEEQEKAEKKARDQEYDKTKRDRRYLPTWENKYPWVSYDDENGTMY